MIAHDFGMCQFSHGKKTVLNLTSISDIILMLQSMHVYNILGYLTSIYNVSVNNGTWWNTDKS